MSVSLRYAQIAIAIIGLVSALEVAPAWSQAKEPPACAAVSFRPVVPDATDGEHDAGVYKSRFGRIVVKGVVKGGRAENHYVTVNNNRPGAAGTLPASVAACAAEKKLPAPGQISEPCNGERFQVLVNRAGDRRYVLLYARQGSAWKLCSAGAA
jgi:hypothetical protein